MNAEVTDVLSQATRNDGKGLDAHIVSQDGDPKADDHIN